MGTALSKTDAKKLAECEETISRGLASFVETGEALRTIRDGKLYLGAYESFEAYCLDRWEMSRIHAHRIIAACEVRNALLPIGNILPANEAQIRPLTLIDRDDVPEVWGEVVETAPKGEDGRPKITAAHVDEVVRRWNECPGDTVDEPEPEEDDEDAPDDAYEPDDDYEEESGEEDADTPPAAPSAILRHVLERVVGEWIERDGASVALAAAVLENYAAELRSDA